MIIGVPKETASGESRVALTPDVVKRVVGERVQVHVEAGAGAEAAFPDERYRAAGAEVVADADGLWRGADVVVKVHPPDLSRGEGGRLREGLVVVGQLQPLVNHRLVRALAEAKVTSFSLDALPRITRAQAMDVLSAMSTVAGYKAVLLAAAHLGRFFPMLVTAAGTIPPAKVLILGAGVAGLQAIATARRLGALVEAFDVRPAVKEQVESLGAKFLATEHDLAAEGAGGYATELSDDQHRRELELIHQHVTRADVVITTALIPGRPAPLLITEEMVRDMPDGAVVVDLAGEAGGNCALTRNGETITAHGVTIMAPRNLPGSMPGDASQMYARNVSAFLGLIVKDGAVHLDFDDEIVSGSCITHEGRVVHEATQRALEEGSGS